MNSISSDNNSGRTCPLDYRYKPQDLAAASIDTTDTLYIVGGLYGNPLALKALDQLLTTELTENPRCIFNGDFNWFNHTDQYFLSINEYALQHDCLRGNVETELARRPFAGGCGCGYPDTVADSVVNWSNLIIATLNASASEHPQLQARLEALPITKRYQVGNAKVQVVHGDCQSLAGWSLARENLIDPQTNTIADISACNADIIACTHTCEPIATTLSSAITGATQDIAVINNGAAGMPNFSHEPFGLITRIGITPSPHETLYGTKLDSVYVEALPLRYDQKAFLDWFLALWPAGTAAHESYFQRLSEGPKTTVADSRGTGFT